MTTSQRLTAKPKTPRTPTDPKVRELERTLTELENRIQILGDRIDTNKMLLRAGISQEQADKMPDHLRDKLSAYLPGGEATLRPRVATKAKHTKPSIIAMQARGHLSAQELASAIQGQRSITAAGWTVSQDDLNTNGFKLSSEAPLPMDTKVLKDSNTIVTQLEETLSSLALAAGRINHVYSDDQTELDAHIDRLNAMKKSIEAKLRDAYTILVDLGKKAPPSFAKDSDVLRKMLGACLSYKEAVTYQYAFMHLNSTCFTQYIELHDCIDENEKHFSRLYVVLTTVCDLASGQRQNYLTVLLDYQPPSNRLFARNLRTVNGRIDKKDMALSLDSLLKVATFTSNINVMDADFRVSPEEVRQRLLRVSDHVASVTFDEGLPAFRVMLSTQVQTPEQQSLVIEKLRQVFDPLFIAKDAARAAMRIARKGERTEVLVYVAPTNRSIKPLLTLADLALFQSTFNLSDDHLHQVLDVVNRAGTATPQDVARNPRVLSSVHSSGARAHLMTEEAEHTLLPAALTAPGRCTAAQIIRAVDSTVSIYGANSMQKLMARLQADYGIGSSGTDHRQVRRLVAAALQIGRNYSGGYEAYLHDLTAPTGAPNRVLSSAVNLSGPNSSASHAAAEYEWAASEVATSWTAKGHTYTVNPGDLIGFRHTASGKERRMVLARYGLTRVFAMDASMDNRFRGNLRECGPHFVPAALSDV